MEARKRKDKAEERKEMQRRETPNEKEIKTRREIKERKNRGDDRRKKVGRSSETILHFGQPSLSERGKPDGDDATSATIM